RIANKTIIASRLLRHETVHYPCTLRSKKEATATKHNSGHCEKRRRRSNLDRITRLPRPSGPRNDSSRADAVFAALRDGAPTATKHNSRHCEKRQRRSNLDRITRLPRPSGPRNDGSRADAVFAALRDGALAIDIAGHYTLDNVHKGHARIEQRDQIGKAVVL